MFQSYESTRNSSLVSTASKAVLKGIADDGGLYVMRNIEDKNIDIERLQGKSYTEIAEEILSMMLDDFPKDKIKQCVKNAYTGKFSTDEITPVVKVGDSYVSELFHGPTSAFKDVALSILPHLLTTAYDMNDLKGEVIILTATSGDTGKAALEGFKDVKGTKIIVFYPDGGVSQVQKAQMATQEGTNTYVCAIKGNFDDAQTGVKNIFANENLRDELEKRNEMFSSANSINIGRLVPQIVYYFYAYMKLVESNSIKIGDKVNFAVPTGNFGNILAGYYAKNLGLPVNKLICGSNENNVLYDFIRTGIYDKNREFHKTISPSMDILVSSNLERLLYYVSGKDNNTIKNLMEQLNTAGKYEVSDEMKKVISEEFYANCVFKNETEETIKSVFEKYGYLLDTHTAVAYKALETYKNETNDNTMSIVLSTASPYKFSKSVYESLYNETNSDEFEIMQELSEKTGVKIPENLKGLKEKKVLHKEVCEKDEMEIYVRKIAMK
ncbi:MAG: threonine synthase [Sedimentibacter saalensis]|uniref:threonine synthase n=1 Tax=Sedimentibacter saalensis TaxID=130788 RepID=UPI0031595966